MKNLILLWFFHVSLAHAYVPTVESLFRHGNNPDFNSNALVVSAKVSAHDPLNEEGVVSEVNPLWVKWVYNINGQARLKLTQLIYRASSMTDASLVDKRFITELVPQAFVADGAKIERGLLLSVMHSMLINDGSFLVDYLKLQGVSVKRNGEILNHEKRALLARHRAWLIKSKGGRDASGEESPLLATDEKSEVASLLRQPLYHDQGQVSLARYQGEPAWLVRADGFEAWVSDQRREMKRAILKVGAQQTEVQMGDFLLFNGTHSFPKEIYLTDATEKMWKIQIMGLKPFNESPAELVARLRRYDQVLKVRQESVARPGFLF